MYSRWSHPTITIPNRDHESFPRHSSEPWPLSGHSQSAANPPRPMEPSCRPTLHTMLTDKADRLRLRETQSSRDPPSWDGRNQSYTLPGVNEILSRDNTTWSAGSVPARSPQTNGTYHVREGIHPPMALEPPTSAEYRYPFPLGRPYAIHNTDDRRQAYLPPQSPLNGYTNGSREYEDVPLEGQHDTAQDPRPSNGVPATYYELESIQSPTSHQTTSVQRPARNSNPQAASESHGKYMGVQAIPGEGEFHMYEDGHLLPTHIDGEHVNPAWGLTKANKPRKRLATACLDCREKKIKCEPGDSGCVQCAKAMRACRKPADKVTQAENAGNSFYLGGSIVTNGASVAESSRDVNRAAELDSLNKRRARADPSPPLGSSKKHRDQSPSPEEQHAQEASGKEPKAPRSVREFTPMDISETEVLSWENDPYEKCPELTLFLVELYFAHFNSATYCFFPRRKFFAWLQGGDPKCQNERMVLYAILAAASIFAPEAMAPFGKQCARVVGDAIGTQVGRFSVAVAQAKLLLAFYHNAKGNDEKEWEYIGAAIRTVTHMELNTERGCLNDAVSSKQPRYEFRFLPEQLAECKRRTFWAAFLQDRFCGAAMGHIKPEDVFTRLPCPEEDYENARPSAAPCFSNGIIDSDKAGPLSPDHVATVAWLMPLAAAWGDITDFVFRASQRGDSTYRKAYESFYSTMQARLYDWTESLPDFLQYSEQNLQRSEHDGYMASFIFMHILYHASLIRLNRYMRHRLMPDVVTSNIRAANYHGRQLLRTAALSREAKLNNSERAEDDDDQQQQTPYVFSTPFIGDAIVAAIDVVSAGGHDSTLSATLEDIYGALGCLRELQEHVSIAKSQFKICEKRYYQLHAITKSPKNARSGCWLGRNWGVKEALDQDVALTEDCVYGLGDREGDEESLVYFEAFGRS